MCVVCEWYVSISSDNNNSKGSCHCGENIHKILWMMMTVALAYTASAASSTSGLVRRRALNQNYIAKNEIVIKQLKRSSRLQIAKKPLKTGQNCSKRFQTGSAAMICLMMKAPRVAWAEN